MLCADEVGPGERIYRTHCALCHGASGEGSDEHYPHTLSGNRALPQLTRYITKYMPKDAPQKCTATEAEQVASYIYEAFYSKAAQERKKPPRIELARLTVRQYYNAVTDLVGSFRTPGPRNEQHGLHGEYFKSGTLHQGERALERLDAEIHFDFGISSPFPRKIDAKEFAIRWEGSVLARETGEYEFVVRTEHATRLWVNDIVHPLVDAWVKSGNDIEHRASIHLLGGRFYSLRLEFSKAKQGVQDSKEKRDKMPVAKASIALEWKPPGQAAQVIPARNLSPARFPEVFVLNPAFPPDDRNLGYERGTSVSEAWDQATTSAAIEVADYVMTHLRELADVSEHTSDRNRRLIEFCRRFAERAFRRPLTDEQRQLYITRQFEKAPDPETGAKRSLLLILKSPRFLYREIGGGRDDFDVASRISFGLWDSLPDPPLLEAAVSKRLANREQVVYQAERMVGDLRTRSKIRTFLFQLLKLDPVPELFKAKDQFPGFDQVAASDLRDSLDLFLDEVVWSEGSDFRQLFLADFLYLNGRLGRFYGANLRPDSPFVRVSQDPHTRAGILSHPYLLATFAHTATSSPIHRGVFLARNVLGIPLRPPPEAFELLPAELHPQLTTRERVALQTRPQQCQACHGIINPLGFTLENFDAIGRFRDRDQGKPIDAMGIYETRKGERVKFAGVRDLATFLADSEEAQNAFIEHLFHYLVKQPIRAFGPRELENLRGFFRGHGTNIRKLIVEIMATSALPLKN
ncbi:MAG TPA: DUF1592 domain-containing protein [Gemmataceae bacterium]|nr:DUF1592 domain-containing protein [Gemmataceae bacterium]